MIIVYNWYNFTFLPIKFDDCFLIRDEDEPHKLVLEIVSVELIPTFLFWRLNDSILETKFFSVPEVYEYN